MLGSTNTTSCYGFKDPTKGFKLLSFECSVEFVLYFCLLLPPIIHNVYYYVYKQKRYQVVLTTLFYVLAFLTAFFRALGYLDYAITDLHSHHSPLAKTSENIATFCFIGIIA